MRTATASATCAASSIASTTWPGPMRRWASTPSGSRRSIPRRCTTSATTSATTRTSPPEYGTLADLDALIDACHARGLRFLLDLVPCHTSIDHPWFVESRSSRESAEARLVHLGRSCAAGRTPVELGGGLRRQLVGMGRGQRAVLPPLVLSGAARPELAQPGRGRGDGRGDALLVPARRRRLPGRRHLRRHQGRPAARQPTRPATAARSPAWAASPGRTRCGA